MCNVTGSCFQLKIQGGGWKPETRTIFGGTLLTSCNLPVIARFRGTADQRSRACERSGSGENSRSPLTPFSVTPAHRSAPAHVTSRSCSAPAPPYFSSPAPLPLIPFSDQLSSAVSISTIRVYTLKTKVFSALKCRQLVDVERR